jgi:hypothetical protein
MDYEAFFRERLESLLTEGGICFPAPPCINRCADRR